jgi:hypothetical protein
MHRTGLRIIVKDPPCESRKSLLIASSMRIGSIGICPKNRRSRSTPAIETLLSIELALAVMVLR